MIKHENDNNDPRRKRLSRSLVVVIAFLLGMIAVAMASRYGFMPFD